MKQRRPKSVTWLTVGVLSLVAVFLTRVGSAIRQWDFLATLHLSISPLYLVVTGVIWSISGILLVWGLWAGENWATKATKAFSLLFTLYYWLEQWMVKRNPLRNVNWPFTFIITLLLLMFVFWTLSRKTARNFFGENDE